MAFDVQKGHLYDHSIALVAWIRPLWDIWRILNSRHSSLTSSSNLASTFKALLVACSLFRFRNCLCGHMLGEPSPRYADFFAGRQNSITFPCPDCGTDLAFLRKFIGM